MSKQNKKEPINKEELFRKIYLLYGMVPSDAVPLLNHVLWALLNGEYDALEGSDVISDAHKSRVPERSDYTREIWSLLKDEAPLVVHYFPEKNKQGGHE